MKKNVFKGLLLFALFVSCSVDKPQYLVEAEKKIPQKIDFNFHIRPIVSDRCYACHGPDQQARKAGLRFDIADSAYAALESGNTAIDPGDLASSTLYQRILSDDPEYMMPPPESHLTLSNREKALLVRWIEQGAKYKEHWSFIPPVKPAVPEVKNRNWVNNPIDNFILSKLEANDIQVSAHAPKERLIRRLYMDIVGLPPAPAAIDSFLNDDNPDVYEKLVDTLLASAHYGERLALDWMDVARYADSHGLHADGWRMMWPWRDWVIKAFNENMPYDQFIIWQLAGDLLPDASAQQILATGFNRNHQMTAEGGVIDEEWRLEYVMDRSITASTAFMGMTMQCARCHDHKFDPLSQKEFYEMAAFFNNVKELGMTGDDGNFGPLLLLPSEKEKQQLAEIDQKIKNKQKELALFVSEYKLPEQTLNHMLKKSSFQPPKAHLSLPAERFFNWKNKDDETVQGIDGLSGSRVKKGVDLVQGKKGLAVEFDYEHEYLEIPGKGLFEYTDPFSGGAWIKLHSDSVIQTIMGNAGSKNVFWRGWDFYTDSLNRLNLKLTHIKEANYLHVRSAKGIKSGEWQHLFFTYDGSGKASGVTFFLNGKNIITDVLYDNLYKSIYPVNTHHKKDPSIKLRIAKSRRGFGGEYGIFSGIMDEILIYDFELSALEVASLVPDIRIPDNTNGLSGQEKQLLSDYYLKHENNEYRQKRSQLNALLREKLDIVSGVPEVMVMEELARPRAMHLLQRGEYDKPGQRVYPATPGAILPFPDELPRNRLGLAQWFTAANHPLTARVTVNRYWQMIFGTGIVKTAHDFGSQGELPTHPQLLDWLAVTFTESGWDVKALIKLMVMSATYQQSSKNRMDLQKRDPQNKMLARAPSYRHQAELIRDFALGVSGLINEEIGGESVKPAQPPGLWREKNNFSQFLLEYKPDSSSDKLYRRSLYTFIRRTSPHPAMTAFDAPDRSECTVQRERTNTPLQALVLLNDIQFVEAAKALALRMQEQGGDNLADRINFAFRCVTGRYPDKGEFSVLEELFLTEQQSFKKEPARAFQLLNNGQYKVPGKYATIETSAYTVLANVLLNHDEAYMKR